MKRLGLTHARIAATQKNGSNRRKTMAKQVFIQRGTAALRGPDGEFIPSVPLYEKITPQTQKGEKQNLTNAAHLFAEVIESRNGGKHGNKIDNRS